MGSCATTKQHCQPFNCGSYLGMADSVQLGEIPISLGCFGCN